MGAVLVLDINDSEIALARDGEVVYRQPGVALVEGRRVLFGDAALARSRLHPRQAHSEFWQRLNADPVVPGGRGVANQADLVYLQLREMLAALGERSRPEAVAAIPPTASNAQLSLLLGIAGEAGLHLSAFVDAAVAAASARPLDGACRLVDLALHRATVAAVDVRQDDGGRFHVRRVAADEVPAVGLASLMEGWIDAVADRFVESTRFDPLRVAATEQQVFDQVRDGVARQRSELTIQVRHGSAAHQVQIPWRAFAEKAEQRYRLLARGIGAPGPVLLTHRAQRPPGLVAFLEAAGYRVTRLPEDAALAGVRRRAEQFAAASDGARLVAALPAESAPTAPAANHRSPTHLLCDGVAMPLAQDMPAAAHPAAGGANGFLIRRNGERLAVVPTGTAEVRLNDERMEFEQDAGAGDVIRCEGLEFRLIAVLDGASPAPA